MPTTLPSPSKGLAMLVPLALMAGCSSLSQQPAPIESGHGTPARSAPAVPHPAPSAEGSASTSPMRMPAPVRPGTVQAPSAGETTHVVQPGETLYRISVNNNLRYQDVAAWNNLPDFNIKVGQVLRLTPPAGTTTPAPAPRPATPSSPVAPVTPLPLPPAAAQVGETKSYPKALKLPYSEESVRSLAGLSEGGGKKPSISAPVSAAPAAPQPRTSAPAASAPVAKPATPQPEASAPASNRPAPAAGEESVIWSWPAEGKVLQAYSENNKGIDIGGRIGQSVLAAGDGKVVYSGNGLRGYGKLIIIKHNKTFLSAYAHNSQLLVKEGQSVKKGQKIAEMGNTDADQVKLHFEIRRFGKPVDPMQYLDSRP